jgi:hypothetical protein
MIKNETWEAKVWLDPSAVEFRGNGHAFAMTQQQLTIIFLMCPMPLFLSFQHTNNSY